MNKNDSQRGMVLFAVLWAIAFCAVLAMATAATFRGLASVVAVDRDRAQADGLLSAGLEAAAGIAAAVHSGALTERSSVVALSTGSVRIHVSDEGGRIDIGRAPVEVLASLLRYIGADDDDAKMLARNIVDLRKPTERTSAEGAARQQAAPDKRDTPAPPPSASPFTDTRQLMNVAGMRAEWMRAMAPLITVYGSDTVNPLTAPVEVISALPFFDEARLDAFLNMRRAPLADPERLAFVLGPMQKYLKVQPTQVVSVELLAGTTDGYAAAAQAFIVLLPDDKQPYRVLGWNPQSPTARANTFISVGMR
jgi:general secretion pathway protein K